MVWLEWPLESVVLTLVVEATVDVELTKAERIVEVDGTG
jgi:hypothetical protein